MHLRSRVNWVGLVCLALSCLPVRGAQPLAIYVLDLDTQIAGENRSVGQDLTNAVETAFLRRRTAFRVLERRKLNEVIRLGKQEIDALSHGGTLPPKLVEQLKGADAVLWGELKETRLDGVVLTLSLTKLDSEKVWQAQRKHSLYEWLSSETRDREAESLAADAQAGLLPAAPAVAESEDGPRGISLANSGKCDEALPLLQNAAAADPTAEVCLQLGRCQNQVGDFAAAARTLTSPITRGSKRADLFVERARSFLGQKMYSRALDDVDQALRVNPDDIPAIELRGDLFMKSGRYDSAVDAYYAAYQQAANRPLCQKLAEAYRKNGGTKAAEDLGRTCPTLR